MNPVDVKENIYIHFGKVVLEKDPKLKVSDHVRISKYKNIFATEYTPNRYKEDFVIKKLKILFHGHMLLVILMVKKSLEDFMKKNSKKNKKKQEEYRIENVIKKRS